MSDARMFKLIVTMDVDGNGDAEMDIVPLQGEPITHADLWRVAACLVHRVAAEAIDYGSAGFDAALDEMVRDVRTLTQLED